MADRLYEEIEDPVDVLLTSLGGLSRWTWPDIPGFNEFKGPISHSPRWDESLTDWGEKKIGVVGVVRLCLELVAREPCAPTHDSLPYIN
jgi:cation diffusion facilitator CzcD-associated flavoprotein CzcO